MNEPTQQTRHNANSKPVVIVLYRVPACVRNINTLLQPRVHARPASCVCVFAEYSYYYLSPKCVVVYKCLYLSLAQILLLLSCCACARVPPTSHSGQQRTRTHTHICVINSTVNNCTPTLDALVRRRTARITIIADNDLTHSSRLHTRLQRAVDDERPPAFVRVRLAGSF